MYLLLNMVVFHCYICVFFIFKFLVTLPETNIAPENRPFQKETSIPTIHFQVRFVSFREGIAISFCGMFGCQVFGCEFSGFPSWGFMTPKVYGRVTFETAKCVGPPNLHV